MMDMDIDRVPRKVRPARYTLPFVPHGSDQELIGRLERREWVDLVEMAEVTGLRMRDLLLRNVPFLTGNQRQDFQRLTIACRDPSPPYHNLYQISTWTRTSLRAHFRGEVSLPGNLYLTTAGMPTLMVFVPAIWSAAVLTRIEERRGERS